MTDQARVPDVAAVAAKLPTGSAIILRDYTAPNRQEIARSLAQLTHQHDLVLLIGGDVELAGAVGADGVHFREQDLTCRADEIARKIERVTDRKKLIVTAAAHSATALQRAADFGADATLLSPVFTTASHPGTTPLGLAQFAALAADAALPVYALGGIDEENVNQLLTTSAIGIAAIGALAT
ncbi:MAG: thiamine monophosphate synthase [Alphaproteobacteria bacterium]|nr:thiamine monophosphate synthase [Alphaproteobacteria bacterium]